MRAAIAISLAIGLSSGIGGVAAGEPAADGGRQAFEAALARARAGDAARAIDELVALADRAPAGAFADDALAEAARLAEEAGDPLRALALYRRLMAEQAGSRLARRAERRAEALASSLGPQGEHAGAVAEYRAALRDGRPEARAAAIERVQRLLEREPDFPLAGEARLWLGDALRDQGHPSESVAWYRAAAAGDPALAGRARLGEAHAALLAGDRERAAALFRELAGASDPALAAAARQGQAKVATAALRERRALAAWGLFAVLVAALLLSIRRALGSWRAVARSLARPPAEVLYAAPIAAVLAAIAQVGHRGIARAVLFIVAGGLAVMWLSGTALAATRHRRRLGVPGAAVLAAAAVLAVIAVIYIALEREHLLDLVLETMRSGPAR